ncbi:MAG: hypothetical protein HOI33_01650 [Rhodospirillaceae bacterium]|jgi:hypothetical protein|nr:hypothetical protein [Rhodospirillaceae bacterium]MBT5658704.1 hypothetical protein [Rhodospirillaceae bacterium]MBT5751390.1 hypothetical protein [Rhodospirillaceae bacterium]
MIRNRGLLIIGALLIAMVIATMIQSDEGIERPWAECKESLFSQMMSGVCTPRQGFGAVDQNPELRGSPEIAPLPQPDENTPSQSDMLKDL